MTDDQTVALARALQHAGKHQQALRALAPVLAGQPSVAALSIGADSFYSLRNHSEAERLARAALAIDPDDYDSLATLALAQAGQHKRWEAWHSVADLVKRHPNFWAAHTQYAQIDLEIRNVSKATFDAAIEGVRLGPSQPTAHAVVGDVYLAQGARAKAAAAYREALRLDPQSSHAQHNLAVATQWRGRSEAIRTFASLTGRHPKFDLAAHNFVVALGFPFTMMTILLVLVCGAGVLTSTLVLNEPVLARVILASLAALVVVVTVVWMSRFNQLTQGQARRLLVAAARLDLFLAAWAAILMACSLVVVAAVFAPSFLPFALYAVFLPPMIFSALVIRFSRAIWLISRKPDGQIPTG